MLKGLEKFNLPEIEEKVLDFWRTNSIFEKSLAIRKGNKAFRFYEGPPYANGRPGIHHALARVFKDIVLRYKAMRGYYVPRKAGWDTHGLPIELETEKQLGIKTKADIEKFGIALFNQKAKESVWQYKDEWERLTERIGFWLDIKAAYITYENSYVESLWWVFREIARRGFLKKNYKIVPFCPRCQTPLASHELGMPGVYKKTTDPSVYVKFKIKNAKDEYLLVWTTTPWTLPANVAVAVDPKLTYTKFLVEDEKGKKISLWSFSAPPQKNGVEVEVAEKISGQKLLGLKYEPLYAWQSPHFNKDKFFEVIGGNFISTEDGTGLVHIAPAFGEDDLEVIKAREKKFDWHSVPMTIDDAGHVLNGFPGAGKFIKDADKDIVDNLFGRGLMYLADTAEHEYPFCWRCSTPLIYFARLSWFFEVSRIREKLVKANAEVNWIPEHIKDGRFGEWIKEAKDWAISRDRYWGTPLPVWECEKEKCGELFVAGSLKDIEDGAFYRNSFLLLRHVEAEANTKGIIASGPEKGAHVSRLTSKGLKDAAKIAKKLKRKRIAAIYASPYERTRQTAEIIGQALKLKVMLDERLSELNCGTFNWRPAKEHKKFFGSPLEEFVKTPPQGENLTDCKKRMLGFLRDINQKYEGKRVLVVGHGDPLWMAEAAAKGLSNEAALALDYIELGALREISLKNAPMNDKGEVDLHRPYADSVYLRCKKCKGRMRRVREVADVWFDSGGMPFASYNYPFSRAGKAASVPGFPADYICEAIDQTRGWFYTLLAVSVLLGKPSPYKNVICLGLILDKHGLKMSKSKGNVVNPWDVIGKHGVDSVRWYFYTVNPPGEPKNFDEDEIGKTMRRVFMIVYNSYVFFNTYAVKGSEKTRKIEKRANILDRWVLSRLADTVQETTQKIENYQIGDGAKEIERFIDDLSRWYIRRSRRRFQKPFSPRDHKEASETLGFVLRELSKLMAPFAPFFAEALWKSLVVEKSSSVHLENWPRANTAFKNETVTVGMEWVRSVATAALAKRAEAGIKVRQPLQKLRVRAMGKIKVPAELVEILKDEINVKEIVANKMLKDELELDTFITPALREEGLVRELTRLIQELRQSAGFKPKDKIVLYLEAGEMAGIFQKNESLLKTEVGAKAIEFKRAQKLNGEITTKLEENDLWIGARKV